MTAPWKWLALAGAALVAGTALVAGGALDWFFSRLLIQDHERPMVGSAARQLRELQAQSGLSLPRGCKLVGWRATKRGSHLDHCQWVVWSPLPIPVLPPLPSGRKGYLSLPLDTVVPAMEDAMWPGHHVRRPLSTYSSYWYRGAYTISGDVVHCADGDYLEVTRYRQQ